MENPCQTLRIVTPDSLAPALDRVRRGESVIQTRTYGRVARIDARTMRRFDRAEAQVLRPSRDGVGLLLARGRHWDYCIPTGLVEITI